MNYYASSCGAFELFSIIELTEFRILDADRVTIKDVLVQLMGLILWSLYDPVF